MSSGNVAQKCGENFVQFFLLCKSLNFGKICPTSLCNFSLDKIAGKWYNGLIRPGATAPDPPKVNRQIAQNFASNFIGKIAQK